MKYIYSLQDSITNVDNIMNITLLVPIGKDSAPTM